jgi:tRNA-Thr(GGU) m(6)t(6)A37 methyltransferase TsaA
MDTIELKPLGIIRTPYVESKDMPIQGRFKDDVEGWIELDKLWVSGLRDLCGSSLLILIHYLHRSGREALERKPCLKDRTHGIFATRSPHRSNRLGLSIVKLRPIEGNGIYFTEVDMLDGTPLLDIKPYVEHFDRREGVRSGWLDGHFAEGGIPGRAILH